MAMLRNLRNMIQAGISEKHHRWVIGKLTDEVSFGLFKNVTFRPQKKNFVSSHKRKEFVFFCEYLYANFYRG